MPSEIHKNTELQQGQLQLKKKKHKNKEICYILTNPEIIQALAHGAALFWDLVEVLVKAWLQGNEPGERWEIVF